MPVVERIMATHLSGAAQYSFAIGRHARLRAGQPGQRRRPDALDDLSRRNDPAPGDPPARGANPRFSPDGKRIALQVAYGSHDQIAIYDIGCRSADAAHVRRGQSPLPIWSPDGRTSRLRLRRRRGSTESVLASRRRPGDARRLTTRPADASFRAHAPPAGVSSSIRRDWIDAVALRILPLEEALKRGGRRVRTRARRRHGTFEAPGVISPDGRLVAYMSSGRARSRSSSGRSRAGAGRGGCRRAAARIRSGRSPASELLFTPRTKS